AVTPPGERHALGMAMVADVLRGRGFEVLELGPDLPVAGLLRVLERLQGLHAVCVSVIDDTHLPACGAVVTAVKASLPEVIVLVGGRAVTGPAQAAALGADGFALEAVGAADLVVELAGCPPP